MVGALLKKRLLGGVLKTYISNADEIATQISFTALMTGNLRVHNVHLIAERLQDGLASFMPLCLEVESCVAHEIEVSLNWQHLSSKPVVLKVREMTVQFVVHNTAMAGDENACHREKKFWKLQAGRVLGDLAALAAMCAAGALPPTLTDRVAQGINVEIDEVTCRLRRPESQVLEAICKLDGLHYGAVSGNFEWTNDLDETRAFIEPSKEVQFFSRFDLRHVSLCPLSGESEASMGPFSMNNVFKAPAMLPLIAPFHCTNRLNLDLGILRFSGPEEKQMIVIKLLSDLWQSMQLFEKLNDLSQCCEEGEEDPIQRFFTGQDISWADLDDDVDDDESEEMQNVCSVIEQQGHWWSSPKLETLTGNSTIQYMVEQRKRVSAGFETFFQLGVRSSIDENSPRQTEIELRDEMSFKSRSSTASENHADKATLRVPNEAVERVSVHANQILIDAVLPEGRLVVDVDDLMFISDSTVPLTSEARSCCAKLFDIPVPTNAPDSASGMMLYNLTVQSLAISLLIEEHAQSSKRDILSVHSFHSQKSEFDSENGRESFDDENVIAQLSKGDTPALTIRSRGPGNPLCDGDLKLQPLDLTILGLKLRKGPGLEALVACSSRVSSALSQVPPSPPPPWPCSCYCLRFVDSVFVQQPPPGLVLCDGRWPIRISVPLMEARTVSSVFDLPKVINATLQPDWKIDQREWWQPAQRSADESISRTVSMSEVQSRLIRLEKEVDYLRQEQLEGTQREDKLKEQLESAQKRWLERADDNDMLDLAAMTIF